MTSRIEVINSNLIKALPFEDPWCNGSPIYIQVSRINSFSISMEISKSWQFSMYYGDRVTRFKYDTQQECDNDIHKIISLIKIEK